MSTRNLTLLTDLYQLTMAQGYWEKGQLDTEACFYMFYRDNPFNGGFAVSCGVDQIVDLVDNFNLTQEDLDYLASLPAPTGEPLFKPEFLEWLGSMELSVDIDVVPDGTLAFPREPLVRVTGPLLQCQLLETCILNGMNFQTLIATKAARVCQAAKGRGVAEFGLRRAQGPDGGLSASRACYVGGCASVANVRAGQKFGIPVSGTHAHSWVMSFPDELTAFRAWVDAMPHNSTLLVDTYDVEQGVKNAITVGKEMEQRGQRLAAIRIDSGDLAWLSKKARKMLDEAGMEYTGIILSNDLDEYTIESLLDQGAQFTGLGVGTRLSTAYDQAALGGVYKLSALRRAGSAEWEPKVKVSEQTWKMTIPGVLDARRYYDENGEMDGDVIVDITRDNPDELVSVDPLDSSRRKKFCAGQKYVSLLQPLVRNGRVQASFDLSAAAARKRLEEQLPTLDDARRRFLNPHRYIAGIEKSVYDKRKQMIIDIRDEGSLY